MRKIVLVSHSQPSRDDRASDQLTKLGYTLDWKVPCDGEVLDRLTPDVAGTVVYGGMFNVPDTPRLPFMQDEMRWLRACIDAGLPTLGICQGAQMIAHVLGAYAGPPEHELSEKGYYEVRPTAEGRDFLPEPMRMTQAHWHTFDIPEGAVRLAGSDAFPNQAFRWKRHVYALQFHPEASEAEFARWQAELGFRESLGMNGAQTLAEHAALGPETHAKMDPWFRGFITELFGPAAA